jgi:hypothetical protein
MHAKLFICQRQLRILADLHVECKATNTELFWDIIRPPQPNIFKIGGRHIKL